MYWNPEHYPDPTAGAALRQLYRKEKDLNTGKQFEADWKKSMPPDAWCYRLKDSAASYYGGNENLSFSIDNICDFDVYRYPMHHYFELKTIETPSILSFASQNAVPLSRPMTNSAVVSASALVEQESMTVTPRRPLSAGYPVSGSKMWW